VPVVINRVEHVILIRHVLLHRLRVVQQLLPDDGELLPEVGTLRVGDLGGGGEGGDLLGDVDEEVGELVQAESTVFAAVTVEDVPESGKGGDQ
jgi:hypothetical protein